MSSPACDLSSTADAESASADPLRCHELRRRLLALETRVARVGALALVQGMLAGVLAGAAGDAGAPVGILGAGLAVSGQMLVTGTYRAGRIGYTACMASVVAAASWVLLVRRTPAAASGLSFVATFAAVLLWMLWRPRARPIFDRRWQLVRAATRDLPLGTCAIEALGWVVMIALGVASPFVYAWLVSVR